MTVDATGLEPGTTYWYRFECDGDALARRPHPHPAGRRGRRRPAAGRPGVLRPLLAVELRRLPRRGRRRRRPRRPPRRLRLRGRQGRRPRAASPTPRTRRSRSRTTAGATPATARTTTSRRSTPPTRWWWSGTTTTSPTTPPATARPATTRRSRVPGATACWPRPGRTRSSHRSGSPIPRTSRRRGGPSTPARCCGWCAPRPASPAATCRRRSTRPRSRSTTPTGRCSATPSGRGCCRSSPIPGRRGWCSPAARS